MLGTRWSLIKTLFAVDLEHERCRPIRHLPDTAANVIAVSHRERSTLIMVTHASLHVLHTHLSVGHYPKGHILCIRVFSQGPRQVTAHILEMVKERPCTRIAETTAREIGLGIRHLPREVGILARKPSLAACKLDNIFGEHHVLLVLHVKLTDAALVGMGTDGLVGYTLGHPHHSLRARTFAHHLHYPSLVGVANGECLALTVVAVGLCQCGHHLDSLACCLGTLQGNVDKRTIVNYTRTVYHFLTPAIGCLAYGYLPLVDIADNIVSLGSLGYLSMILVGIPVENFAHFVLSVLTCREVTQALEHTIIVGTVRADDRTVGRSLFAHNEIGASICLDCIKRSGSD